MALTAEQYQDLIITQVGDQDGVFAGLIDMFWEQHSAESDIKLQALLTTRTYIDALQGHLREQVDQADIGASAKLSQKIDHLQTMRKNVDGEIATKRAEAKITDAQILIATHRPLTGRLTATLGPVSDAVGLLRP